MYAFVRFTAVVLMIIGVLVMILGIVYAINVITLFFPEIAAPAPFLPPVSPPAAPLPNLMFAAVVFFQGLFITALGQLMLLFVDIAMNTHETVHLLRASRQLPPSRPGREVPPQREIPPERETPPNREAPPRREPRPE